MKIIHKYPYTSIAFFTLIGWTFLIAMFVDFNYLSLIGWFISFILRLDVLLFKKHNSFKENVKKNLRYELYWVDGYWHVESNELNIIVWEKTIKEAFDAVDEFMESLISMYYLEEDKNLSVGARKLKQRIKELGEKNG